MEQGEKKERENNIFIIIISYFYENSYIISSPSLSYFSFYFVRFFLYRNRNLAVANYAYYVSFRFFFVFLIILFINRKVIYVFFFFL
jgi:hypothetical protein